MITADRPPLPTSAIGWKSMTRLFLVASAVFHLNHANFGHAADAAPPQELPRVLILGDSISIGYTPYVREMLQGEAEVVRPVRGENEPENCAGTLHGVQEIDRWLKIGGGHWDVIHFNFGLHDLKRVDPETGDASNRADHPRQSEPEAYARQLEKIVAKLQATQARLIFATTTPVPSGGVRPHRDAADPRIFNDIAVAIMRRHEVAVNDLYEFARPRLKELQRPVNVHFTEAGSRALAGEVVRHIREALQDF